MGRLEAVKGWGWEGLWMDGVQRAFSWRSTPENHEYRGGVTAETRPLFRCNWLSPQHLLVHVRVLPPFDQVRQGPCQHIQRGTLGI